MNRTTPAMAAVIGMAAFVLSAIHPPRAAACAAATMSPRTSGITSYERALTCLVNVERHRRGRRALGGDARLARTAGRHAADMVARGYFSHRAPGGATPADRLRRAGYLPRYGAWLVAEALAYGRGRAASPRSIVRAWLRSPAHRAVVLHRGARDIGVGAAAGTPARRRGITVALNVGRR